LLNSGQTAKIRQLEENGVINLMNKMRFKMGIPRRPIHVEENPVFQFLFLQDKWTLKYYEK